MSTKVMANGFGSSGAYRNVTTTNQLVQPVADKSPQDDTKNAKNQQNNIYKMEIIWKNIAFFIVVHIIAIYGSYHLCAYSRTPFGTFFYTLLCGHLSAMGITAAAHRFWTHRTYKATLTMRIILMLMQSFSFQNNIYEWARDHRVHHKYTDTDADPHNSTRGFFFSHVGWLLVKKHPEVKRRGQGIDMSDVLNDPVVQFQMKYELIIKLVLSLIIPTWIPIYFWGERFDVALFMVVFRWVVTMHCTWFVNSAAHMWGSKPYDKFISPTENLFVGILAYGEGWHNYHHVYPWDYKAAELGNYRANWTTAFIDFCSALGLTYDLKTVSEEMVRKRAEKSGDNSWQGRLHSNDVWGWDDKDMAEEDKKGTQILKNVRYQA